MSTDDLPATLTSMISVGTLVIIVTAVAGEIGQFQFFSSSSAWQSATAALGYMDYLAPFLQVSLFVIMTAFASRIRTNKVFLPVSFAVLIINVLLAGIFSNVYLAMVTGSALQSAANSLPLWNLLLSNLPLMILISGIGVIGAMYSNIGAGGATGAR